jgi:catechol 2,3-dioxygenase-like lactoylglutathione lyase family enzyme
MAGSIESQITFLGTADLAATADFYERVLGLELTLDQGDCRIYATREGAFIGFCERGAHPEGIILTLVTQDVDGWYELLSARGVEFEKPPAHNADYQIYHCFFRDPSGYLIEIQRFEDSRWRRGDQ